MLRGPEEVQKAEATAAAGYMTDTAQVLGLERASQLPAEQVHALDLGRLAADAAGAVIKAQQLFEINTKATKALFGSFIPALISARAAAHDIALTQGQFTPTDEASLAQAGTGLKNLQEYFAPFQLQEHADLSSEIPPISIGTVLRLKGMGGEGKDGYFSASSSTHLVSYDTQWPDFSANFDVPVLVDPKIYTMDELTNMPAESADGYAAQVADTWRSIKESERDHPSFTGEPLVIRAVAVLPVPPAEAAGESEFAVDFLPKIAMSQADIEAGVKRAYDVRLLVKGDKNLGANYVKYEFGTSGPQPIFANSQGKRAPLTVQRSQAIEEGLPESVADLGLTPRSQGAVALYITPHVVKERAPDPLPLISSSGDGRLRENTRMGLGGASVAAGPASTWMTSVKQTEDWSGRVAPELRGRPIIMSIQLLTFER